MINISVFAVKIIHILSLAIPAVYFAHFALGEDAN